MTTPDTNECGSGAGCLHKNACIEHLEAEVERLRAQVAEWEKLREPDTLHANLLRGVPAQLTADHLQHLLGAPAAPAQQAHGWPDAADWLERESRAVYSVCLREHAEAAQWLRDTSTATQAAPAQQAEPPCPYYIAGPYADGTYAAADMATGRVVARIPERAPSLTVGDEPTEDQCIELAAALEMHRALHIVAEVAALPVGGDDEPTTSFHAGYQLACEEITERIRTQEVVIPGGAVLPQCGTLPSIAQPAAQGIDERATFEADFLRRFNKPGYLGRDEDGDYGHMVSRARWEGWQARAALAQAPAAEPLTKKRLNAALQKLAESLDSMNIVMTHWPEVARAIERAHGIGAAKGQP